MITGPIRLCCGGGGPFIIRALTYRAPDLVEEHRFLVSSHDGIHRPKALDGRSGTP